MRWFLAILALGAASGAHAVGPAGPAVVVKQVTPPKTVVSGVRTLKVAPFSGLEGEAVAAQAVVALQDGERLATDAAAIAKQAVGIGTELAANAVQGLVGGGLQGQIAKGLTQNTVEAVQEEMERDPLVLDDGLTVLVWTVGEGRVDATLSGSIKVEDAVEDYKSKVQQTDSNGNVVKDADGKPVQVEVSCKRRNVTVTVDWAITGSGELAKGSIERKSGDSRCGDDVSNLADADTLARQVLAGAGTAIAREVSPSWRVRRLPLDKDKAFKEAFKPLRDSDWGAARCAFEAAAKANPASYEAQFDHGVLLEAYGFFDAARAQYLAAQAIQDKKPIQKALERVTERQAEVQQMVDAYGLTWKIPVEPTPCAP